MTTSADHDQERRRSKSKVRASWQTRFWRVLVRPKTWTFLVSMGRLIASAVWLYHWITEHMRK